MKKVLTVLAGAAAIGGAAWLLYRKFGKPSMMISGEFEEDEPIVLEEETVTEEVAEEE